MSKCYDIPDTRPLQAAVLRAMRLSYRDSNDDEVHALIDALSLACALLDVDLSAVLSDARRLEEAREARINP